MKDKYKGKGQANRLIDQQKTLGGAVGIFGETAKKHDASINLVTEQLLFELKKENPHLEFRKRASISKEEINKKLQKIDNRLGKTLFVKKANIKPDGGIIEVKDSNQNWRILLIGESKHQGNDIEKFMLGIKQGKNKDQDLMVAGNAIERVHKNILEIRNFMLDEDHFPYVVFLQGTNFSTTTTLVEDKTGRVLQIKHDSGGLNRIDRVTASNFAMEINTNYCINISINNLKIQAASLYFQCDQWTFEAMLKISLEIATDSLNTLKQSGSLPLK